MMQGCCRTVGVGDRLRCWRSQIANHRVFRQGPLILFDQSGNFELEHAQSDGDLFPGHRRGWLLCSSCSTLPSGERRAKGSRKHLAHWAENSQQVCIGAVGGTFMVRTTLMLLVTTIKLLSGSQPEVSFFGTREASRRLTELQRTNDSPRRRPRSTNRRALRIVRHYGDDKAPGHPQHQYSSTAESAFRGDTHQRDPLVRPSTSEEASARASFR